jgi:hypothetical protein
MINRADGAGSIIYGFDGNIYVAGVSFGSNTYKDFTVISLNPETGIGEEKGRGKNLRSISPFIILMGEETSLESPGQKGKKLVREGPPFPQFWCLFPES